MSRTIWVAATAGLMALIGASSTRAAPGDGIAAACIGMFEADFKAGRRRVNRYYPHRKALCRCMERRVKADASLLPGDKDQVREIFKALASDRHRARAVQRIKERQKMRRVGRHIQACNREVLPRTPDAPDKPTPPKN